MSDGSVSQTEDRKMLKETPIEKLLNLFLLHIRNLWRVDGLYFLGIEESFDTDSATNIDANCWRLMGRIEARDLKRVLRIEGDDLDSFMRLLRNTSWSLDQKEVETEVSEGEALYQVNVCRTQQTRMRKGLEIFPCKKVRLGYLKSFAKEFNPNIEVICEVCPPDERPEGLWCRWRFELKA